LSTILQVVLNILKQEMDFREKVGILYGNTVDKYSDYKPLVEFLSGA